MIERKTTSVIVLDGKDVMEVTQDGIIMSRASYHEYSRDAAFREIVGFWCALFGDAPFPFEIDDYLAKLAEKKAS